MAITRAFQALKSSSQLLNSSEGSLTQLPANILEIFIPGYSIISGFLLDFLGFDIALIVSICLFAFGFTTAVKFIWTNAYKGFQRHFMSFIQVDSDDDIFKHVMHWLRAQHFIKNSRRLVAKTDSQTVWDLEDTDAEQLLPNKNNLLNFRNWEDKIPPKFQPYRGRQSFFHNGRYFELSLEVQDTMRQGWAGTIFSQEETMTLSCVGRSPQPIKDLLKECRDHYLEKSKASTVVRRPATKESRSRGRNFWTTVASRPSRPMSTVVLDNTQKECVLADINEYLHPSTPRWYANRGIPYRRGYLFAGPPGTGKSSLAWAIAGVFGLDIYCISLVDPSLTEEDLGLLFTSLPRRCIVLLEDIDSAGLIRRQEMDLKNAEGDTVTISAEIANAIIATKDMIKKKKDSGDNQGISLSGLLNAIDGVASHEGRVLIMTSNFPEKLDDALIRPGRIDLRVDFTMATRYQIRELFTRMYSPDESAKSLPQSTRIEPAPTFKNDAIYRGHVDPLQSMHDPVSELAETEFPPPYQTLNGNCTSVSSTVEAVKLEDISVQFADKLPDGVFSPAEIQGFLLMRKKDPLQALVEVEEWREKLLESKADKSRTNTNDSTAES